MRKFGQHIFANCSKNSSQSCPRANFPTQPFGLSNVYTTSLFNRQREIPIGRQQRHDLPVQDGQAAGGEAGREGGGPGLPAPHPSHRRSRPRLHGRAAEGGEGKFRVRARPRLPRAHRRLQGEAEADAGRHAGHLRCADRVYLEGG